MIYPEPVYTLAVVFTPAPLVTCFGLAGLIDTVPRLKPDLYWILDHGGRVVGDATWSSDGEWWLELESGVKAGPGFIIV